MRLISGSVHLLNFVRMLSDSSRAKIRLMRNMLLFTLALTVIKFAAWLFTNSNAILTDALESIINVVAGAFALFSTWYAAQPPDKEHPYGHGKIEYLSAGFEGALIFLAGITISGKAIYGFIHPTDIDKIDLGVLLTAIAALGNFFMGRVLVSRGKKMHSAIMIADGKHLLSDTLSSAGLVVGLAVMYFTNWFWLDNVLALLLGAVIIRMGWKLFRESLGSLLDEADQEKLEKLVGLLNSKRRPQWIDMHNLRVQKFGSHLHIDAHITLPWYYSLENAHAEVDAVSKAVSQEMGQELEFFIHADPCIPSSCSVCSLHECAERKHAQVSTITWTIENMIPDKKHTLL
ncbi:MAG: cation diffusion facilitator family transporter [Bacteroidetes bacterium]|nr:MAG: cation diffusion facilitator family transporter [Bacteroidota bacterium]